MSKRKLDSKSFAKQKQNRRKWLTFVRMCRYGINNFSRNAWLTIAATAVMTITLLIIFIAVAAHSILADSVNELRKKVDMSIYLKTETTDDQAAAIKQQLQKLSSVQTVNYISAEAAKAQIVQDNKNDVQYLSALNEATNKNPGILRIVIKDINDTSQLSQFVDTNSLLKQHIDPARAPSFAGERRASIESIGRAISFVEQVGIAASLVFVAISSLIIFNTIGRLSVVHSLLRRLCMALLPPSLLLVLGLRDSSLRPKRSLATRFQCSRRLTLQHSTHPSFYWA
jgi:cell division transport system permease protein